MKSIRPYLPALTLSFCACAGDPSPNVPAPDTSSAPARDAGAEPTHHDDATTAPDLSPASSPPGESADAAVESTIPPAASTPSPSVSDWSWDAAAAPMSSASGEAASTSPTETGDRPH